VVSAPTERPKVAVLLEATRGELEATRGEPAARGRRRGAL